MQNLTRTLLVLLLVGGLVGCDSNDDGGDTEAAVTELSSMFGNMQSALFLAFDPTILGAGLGSDIDAFDGPVDCPQGGTLTVDAEGLTFGFTGFDFDLDVALDDCNGIDGALDYTGSGSFALAGESLSSVAFTSTLSGTLTEQCTITFDGFEQTIAVDGLDGETFDAFQSTTTLNGSFDAACDSGSLTCTFDDATLDLAGDNTDLFLQSCN